MRPGTLTRAMPVAGLLGALALVPVAAPEAPPRSPVATRTVARDVAAGRTGVWLLSQVIRVSGPRTAPTLTDVGARLERIDPSSGRSLARIDLPVAAEHLVQGPSGRLWVTGSQLALIDPRPGRVRLTGGPGDLVADGRRGAWSWSARRRALARRSSTGRAIGPPVPLAGPRPAAMAFGADGLFLVRAGAPGILERRHPRTGRLLAKARVGRVHGGLVLRGGSVWALAGRVGILVRIEPTLRRTSRIRLARHGAAGADLAVGGGAAWVVDRSDGGRVVRIDPRTEGARARRLTGVPRATLPIAVATGRRSVWVVMLSDGTRSALCRLDPPSGSVERCFGRSI